ncbi:hypothetical protein FHR75_004484 [Kineococcus radiotolerans]|uniref:Uncharacterized protein n=1 Tax=Kineococcus radiotolerans TaxID=131568 RepID=A0A7W4TSF9_KINRA|nr:hypothetical protein [Kineococcus radiotolerans]
MRLDRSVSGLPEISRWDPVGRPESYRPQDLEQVVLDLQDAELLTVEEAERAAVRDALALVRRCQREGLYLSVLPD